MPELARKYEERYYYYGEQRRTCTAIPDRRPFGKNVIPVKKYNYTQPKRKKRVNADKDVFIARFLGIFLLLTIGIFILPTSFKTISGSMFTKSPYPKLKAEYNKIVFPTLNYVNNHIFLNELSLNGTANKKKALMKELPVSNELTDLETSIRNIMPMYPAIHPSVFVWDYDSGNYADINGEEIFPAASIIKIPVLIQLFKSIEAKQLSLYDSMELTDYYRAEGSGNLQFKAENSTYTIDYLARIMITDSDNSATNMIISKLGSMTDINQGLRDWGIKQTQIKTWLPDMQGTNYTTAKDLARMLYNIENPKFLSDNSRTKIISYMSHVKNNRLIQAGLGSGASFIHKTGDIGKMLGDAGVVTTPNGKKYIVIIMANRPYNSPEGKDFIVKASEIIYNYMVVK